MSFRRRVLAWTVAATVVVGQLAAVVTRSEPWPFSWYPMFSSVRGPQITSLPRLVGVTADDREIPLRGGALAPFSHSRATTALGHLHATGDQEAVERALADALVLHERWRRPSDPPLDGLRLYRVRWDVDLSAPRPAPDTRVLLAEVTRSP